MRATALVLLALLAVPAAATPATPQPVPLRGVPLPAGSKLRLLVASNPPFVVDVDRGRVEAVRGLGDLIGGILWLVPVGGRSGVVVAESFGAATYGVRGSAARVHALGTGTNVWPAADRRSVWLQRRTGSRCTLRRAALDGRVLRAARAFPCATRTDPGGPLGIVVGRTRLLDPGSGRTVFRSREGIAAVARRHLVTVGEDDFALVDPATGAEQRFEWPSAVGGLDEAVVDPAGRYVALGSGNPAWDGGGRQVLDVWVLDTATGDLVHLPGMPAFVGLKLTSMAWTDDGRLVLLAETERRTLVAVWRPGEERLAVKAVRLPERDSGSDAFAPLR